MSNFLLMRIAFCRGVELVNVARVKGLSLAYPHVIHLETLDLTLKVLYEFSPFSSDVFPFHLENYPECVLRTIG